MPEPTILTYAGWEQDARLIIGTTEQELTDAQLYSIILLGQAERYVKERIINWEDLEGESLMMLRLAVLYMIAHYAKENMAFLMPTTLKDGENYISWGNRGKSSQKDIDPYYDQAWEYIYTLLGTYTEKAVARISLPNLDLTTGD